MGPFNWRGRSSLKEYIRTLALCLFIGMAATWPFELWRHPLVGPALGAALVVAVVGSVMRRLHDSGLNAWRVAIPTGVYGACVVAELVCTPHGWVNHILQIVVFPGTICMVPFLFGVGVFIPNPGPNRFGPGPPETPARTPRSGPSEPLGEEAARMLRRMKRRAESALILRPAAEPSFSKLGGHPDLDDREPWPTSPSGEPLAFVGQFDLAEVHARGGPDWLPDHGYLFVFTLKGGWDVNAWKVIYRTERTAAGSPPGRAGFPERRIEMAPTKSYPSLDWLGIDVRESDLSDSDLEALLDFPDSDSADALNHQIGGYPSELQDATMAPMCELRTFDTDDERLQDPKLRSRAMRNWRLLLQIGDEPGLKIAPSGVCIYFFVRTAEARTGDFSNVWMLMQAD